VDRRRAVVAAVRGENFGASSEESRHAHGVLHCLGATVREEDLRRAAKGVIEDQLGGPVSRFVPVLRRDRRQDIGLSFDGCHDGGMLMPDVGVNELR
jgi:hypothetical protein